MFFMNNLTIDRNFGVFDESGTYNDQESYKLDPKLNLTLTALLSVQNRNKMVN